MSEPIEYRGFHILPETDPWGLKYLGPIRYFALKGDRIYGADSIEDAKREIDERIAEQENKLKKS